MGIIENIVFPIGIVVLIGGTVVCGVGSCVHKAVKNNNQHAIAVLNNHQQDLGMKMSDFAEKYGPPRDVKDTEGIKFYTYVIEDTYLTITTKEGVVTKVSRP